MAEAQTRAEVQIPEFHVPLAGDEAENDATDAEETGSDAATDAGESEQAAQGEELFPAEEVGVDENSPEYQAIRKKMIAAYQRKVEALKKSLKPSDEKEAAPAASATEQPAAQQPAGDDDPFDAIYNVDFKAVKPSLQFREGSDLADYGDELADVIAQAVDQKIEAVLNGIKNNDKQYRQQMTQAERVSKAHGAIAAYANEIQDHPEYAEKADEIAAFARRPAIQQLAIEDPETLIDMMERKFGLQRGWKGETEAAQRSEGQRNLKLATKSRDTVSRPTRPLGSGALSKGESSFESALNRAMRARGL